VNLVSGRGVVQEEYTVTRVSGSKKFKMNCLLIV